MGRRAECKETLSFIAFRNWTSGGFTLNAEMMARIYGFESAVISPNSRIHN